MASMIDLSGRTFSRWFVVHRTGNRRGSVVWLCRCMCGTEKEVPSRALMSGESTSCGCFQRDSAALKCKARATHGMSNAREYAIWSGILSRCRNPNSKDFQNYGGRGIYVSERWLVFENFFHDMGPSAAGMSIERLDNDGPYCKENCKWATRQEQNRNSRHNRNLVCDGESKPLGVWAELMGISRSCLDARLKSGWSVEKAIRTPTRPHKKYTKNPPVL